MKTKTLIAAAALTLCGNAYAASVTYFLDQSNVLPDGFNYVKVTISDSTVNLGDIDFLVETTSAFTPGSNFGIQAFGFNPSIKISSANIYNLNGSWTIGTGTLSGFGRFAVTEIGIGNSRLNPLTFSIHADGDSIYSYANGSKNWSGIPGPYFAAHVAGFTSDIYDENGNMVTSAYFSGSTLEVPPTVVPVPAAGWLLGSGLIGLVGISRRKIS